MIKKEAYLTSSEEVLVAAYNLSKKGKKIFTEWDLTVETWKLNNNKWGLRGFESNYPDHKRVMNEIMAKGDQKVIGKGWIERVKPNYYRITEFGMTKASDLNKFESTKKERSLYEYDAISKFIENNVFAKYCEDPEEPKTWLGAASFLNLTKNDPVALDTKLRQINGSIDAALKWLETNKTDTLIRSGSAKPISKNQIVKLKEFVKVLEKRFEPQFKAIRSKKK